MWFDPMKALAEIEAGQPTASAPPTGATRATRATQAPEAPPRVAHVARVARPPAVKSETAPAPCRTSRTCRTPAAAEAAIPLDPETPDGDARAYLAHLTQHGPATVGAAGSALGWGATRAWQAEARLRAAGLVKMGPGGQAVPSLPSRPVRVLNAREVGRDVPGAVYCGRPSPWGNPFRIGKDGTRAEVVAKFREWLMARPELVAKARAELRGRDLICWCAPAACHCDVLAEVANVPEEGGKS